MSCTGIRQSPCTFLEENKRSFSLHTVSKETKTHTESKTESADVDKLASNSMKRCKSKGQMNKNGKEMKTIGK